MGTRAHIKEAYLPHRERERERERMAEKETSLPHTKCGALCLPTFWLAEARCVMNSSVDDAAYSRLQIRYHRNSVTFVAQDSPHGSLQGDTWRGV